MHKDLEVSDVYITNNETGKIQRLDTVSNISIDWAVGKDKTSFGVFKFSGEGNFNIIRPVKLKLAKLVYKGWKDNYYKHLKRVENRKILHKKLKKLGR